MILSRERVATKGEDISVRQRDDSLGLLGLPHCCSDFPPRRCQPHRRGSFPTPICEKGLARTSGWSPWFRAAGSSRSPDVRRNGAPPIGTGASATCSRRTLTSG